MVTRTAVGEASGVHDRMPLVLPQEFQDEWLDTARSGDHELVQRAILASDEISRELQAMPRRRLSAPAPPTLFDL